VLLPCCRPTALVQTGMLQRNQPSQLPAATLVAACVPAWLVCQLSVCNPAGLQSRPLSGGCRILEIS
jgi:hypothetical protein